MSYIRKGLLIVMCLIPLYVAKDMERQTKRYEACAELWTGVISKAQTNRLDQAYLQELYTGEALLTYDNAPCPKLLRRHRDIVADYL